MRAFKEHAEQLVPDLTAKRQQLRDRGAARRSAAAATSSAAASSIPAAAPAPPSSTTPPGPVAFIVPAAPPADSDGASTGRKPKKSAGAGTSVKRFVNSFMRQLIPQGSASGPPQTLPVATSGAAGMGHAHAGLSVPRGGPPVVALPDDRRRGGGVDADSDLDADGDAGSVEVHEDEPPPQVPALLAAARAGRPSANRVPPAPADSAAATAASVPAARGAVVSSRKGLVSPALPTVEEGGHSEVEVSDDDDHRGERRRHGRTRARQEMTKAAKDVDGDSEYSSASATDAARLLTKDQHAAHVRRRQGQRADEIFEDDHEVREDYRPRATTADSSLVNANGGVESDGGGAAHRRRATAESNGTTGSSASHADAERVSTAGMASPNALASAFMKQQTRRRGSGGAAGGGSSTDAPLHMLLPDVASVRASPRTSSAPSALTHLVSHAHAAASILPVLEAQEATIQALRQELAELRASIAQQQAELMERTTAIASTTLPVMKSAAEAMARACEEDLRKKEAHALEARRAEVSREIAREVRKKAAPLAAAMTDLEAKVRALEALSLRETVTRIMSAVLAFIFSGLVTIIAPLVVFAVPYWQACSSRINACSACMGCNVKRSAAARCRRGCAACVRTARVFFADTEEEGDSRDVSKDAPAQGATTGGGGGGRYDRDRKQPTWRRRNGGAAAASNAPDEDASGSSAPTNADSATRGWEADDGRERDDDAGTQDARSQARFSTHGGASTWGARSLHAASAVAGQSRAAEGDDVVQEIRPPRRSMMSAHASLETPSPSGQGEHVRAASGAAQPAPPARTAAWSEAIATGSGSRSPASEQWDAFGAPRSVARAGDTTVRIVRNDPVGGHSRTPTAGSDVGMLADFAVLPPPGTDRFRGSRGVAVMGSSKAEVTSADMPAGRPLGRARMVGHR